MANAQKVFTVETLRTAAKQSLRCLVVPVRLRRAIKKYLREEDDPHIRKRVRQLSESFKEIKDTNLLLPETTAKSLADSVNSVETKRWKIHTVYGDSGLEYRDGETAAYIASRMPAVFSVCYRVLIEVATWVSSSVVSAFFTSLKRCACLNLTTTDPDDEFEAKDRPL